MKNLLNFFFKWATRSFFFFLLALLLVFNLGFHQEPDFTADQNGTWNEDVFEQLQFLKQELASGAADDMQQLFPEGHLFMHALYGLAWADFADSYGSKILNETTTIAHDSPPSKVLLEIDQSLRAINSPTGRQVFDEDLLLPYGIFYKGWGNYLLSKKINLRVADEAEDEGVILYRRQCNIIAEAFQQAPSPWLESYRESAWPADNVVAMASLAAYDRTFGTNLYQAIIEQWLVAVRDNLDPMTGLIPHATDPNTGSVREGARGSSQSLMLCFLTEIDPAFAAEQYALYKEHFLDYRLGRAGIREYPKGQQGSGDVDSGPVIWGIGGSASVVGQRAAGMNGDGELFADLRGSLQAFGFAFSWNGKRRYLFGKLPVADAFIGWANAAHQQPGQFSGSPIPWQLHLYSLLFAALLNWLIRKI